MHTSCQNPTPCLMMKMWKHSHQRLKKQGSPYVTFSPKLTINRFSLLKEIGDINIRKAKASLFANDVISCLEYPR